MRLPVIGNISTKDGATNKNARLTNMLAEQKKNGTTLATVRPGLNAVASTSGNGNGLVCFGGELINIFGSVLGKPILGEYRYDTTTTGTVADTIIDGVKFGSNYIIRSEQAIYTSADLATFTYYDPGGLAYYARMPVASDSICLASYEDENAGVFVLSWDSGMALTVTAYQSGIAFPQTFGSGKFVANASQIKTATSVNGINWTLGSDMAYPDGAASLYGNEIKHNGSLFCRLSLDDATPYQNLYSYVSSDGLQWGGPYLVRPGMSVTSSAFAQIDGNGFIYAYDGYCKTSVNGSSWTTYALTDEGFEPRAVAFNATSGLLCMVGKVLDVYPTYTYHTIFSADNGKTWMSSSDSNRYTAIIPSGSGFVLFKYGGDVNYISNITNLGEIANLSSVEDNPTDFALIP